MVSKPRQKPAQLSIQTAISKARNGVLLDFEDLPTPWRINSHIRSGYFFSSSIIQCGSNLFRLSNETFNIWSHILGLAGLWPLALYAMPQLPEPADRMILALYLGAAAICFACSTVWHSMKSISCPHLFIRCVSADFTGVSLVISATALSIEYAAFYCNPVLQAGYMTLTTACAISCIFVVWQPFLRDNESNWVCVSLFVLLGSTGLLPFLHLAILKDLSKATEFYRPLLAQIVAPVFSGAIVFATRFPEILWPGRFDFVGSSHNIWHVAVLLAVYGGYGALGDLFQRVAIEAQTGFCDQHNPLVNLTRNETYRFNL